MTVEKTQVQVELTGDAKAIADAKRVERAMNEVEREAKQAQTAVDSARASETTGLRGRFRGLLGRAGVSFQDEDVRIGKAIKFGRGGFALQEEYKKGNTGAFGAGAARVGFTAMIAGQALGAGLNQIADIRDFIDENQNLTAAQIMQAVASGASKRIFDTFGSTSILRGASRLSGVSTDVFDNATQLAFGELSDVEQAIDAQAANRRAFRQAMEKQERIEAKRREAAEEALRKIDEITERQLSGLKTDVYRPRDIRLNRKQNQEAQRRYGDSKRTAIEKQAAAAREVASQVLDGEGR